MPKKRNPWLLLLCWLIGVPLGLYFFIWGAVLSMGGGADFITVCLFIVVVLFVFYMAIRHSRKQKTLSQKDEH